MFNKTITLTAVIFVLSACQLQAKIDVSGPWTFEWEELHKYDYSVWTRIVPDGYVWYERYVDHDLDKWVYYGFVTQSNGKLEGYINMNDEQYNLTGTISNSGEVNCTVVIPGGSKFYTGFTPNGQYFECESEYTDNVTDINGTYDVTRGIIEGTYEGGQEPHSETYWFYDFNDVIDEWQLSSICTRDKTYFHYSGEFTISGEFTVGGIYISSIEPSSGAPGIQVTIHGQGFNAPCQRGWVNFGPSEIWGRGLTSTKKSWTDTEIVVEVPKPALPNPSGERVVEVTVQKFFPTQASNSVSFTYKMPHIDSITPSSATPRTEVVIRGQNFGVPNKHLPEGYGIKFGLSNAYYWKSWTDNEIVIQAPKDYGTGQTEANYLKAIVKVLMYGLPELPPPLRSVIEALIEELIDSGVGIMPSEGEVRVNVIVTTPVGESNAEPFTFTVK